MGCFHNLHNKNNRERADGFFSAGHFGMALEYYQRALEELQSENVIQNMLEQHIDELQKRIQWCKELGRRKQLNG